MKSLTLLAATLFVATWPTGVCGQDCPVNGTEQDTIQSEVETISKDMDSTLKEFGIDKIPVINIIIAMAKDPDPKSKNSRYGRILLRSLVMYDRYIHWYSSRIAQGLHVPTGRLIPKGAEAIKDAKEGLKVAEEALEATGAACKETEELAAAALKEYNAAYKSLWSWYKIIPAWVKSRDANKEVEKAIAKVTEKTVALKTAEDALKLATKEAAKEAAGKITVKHIPVVGAFAGLGFGIYRACEGDWTGAGMEVTSGALSGLGEMVPAAGLWAAGGGAAMDISLVLRDVHNAHESAKKDLDEAQKDLTTKQDILRTKATKEAEVEKKKQHVNATKHMAALFKDVDDHVKQSPVLKKGPEQEL